MVAAQPAQSHPPAPRCCVRGCSLTISAHGCARKEKRAVLPASPASEAAGPLPPQPWGLTPHRVPPLLPMVACYATAGGCRHGTGLALHYVFRFSLEKLEVGCTNNS